MTIIFKKGIMAPNSYSELGAYKTITGSGLPSKDVHGGDNLRLGPLSPCKCQEKNNHFAGVPHKKLGVQNDRVDTNSAVDTKKKNIFAFLPTDF